MITDGYNDFIVRDNTNRYSVEGQAAVLLVLQRDTQDGKQPVTFRVRTRTFVRIGYIVKKLFGNIERLGQKFKVIIIRAYYVYPTVGKPLCLFHKAGLTIKIHSHLIVSFRCFARAETLVCNDSVRFN